MSNCNNLSPVSQTTSLRLPATSSVSSVASNLCLGFYGDSNSPLYSTAFLTAAAEQTAYTYNQLGGNVLDIELEEKNIFCCYEDAVLEYSYLMNLHQSKNVLSALLGTQTGTFDAYGNFTGSGNPSDSNVKYPKYTLGYALRVATGFSEAANVGGEKEVYSASFDITASVQDYDIQDIIESASANDSDEAFYGKVGTRRVDIKRVYWKTPHAMWRFFGYYGALNVVGNLSYYGQYADDTTFEVVPAWQQKLQAQAYEDAIYVRNSHFGYEIHNNKIRLYPVPTSQTPTKMWVQFTIRNENPFESDPGTEATDTGGVNNVNNLPFENLPFSSINSIGKHWIRRYALACSKKVLGQIRGKISSGIPIPGQTVTLNADQLLSQAEKEMTELRQQFVDILDQLTYDVIESKEADRIDATNRILRQVPMVIYVG